MFFVRLKEDKDFIELIGLIAKFSLETVTPFWKNVYEVSASFSNPSVYYTYIIVNDEGVIEGYFHGNLINHTEFHFSQAYHRKGVGNGEYLKILETELRRVGVEKIVCLVTLPPQMFEKYGFKFERYYLGKYIK